MTVLFIVLAVIILIMLIPVGVIADYDSEGFKLLLKVSFFEIKPDFSKKKPKKEKKKEFKLDFGLNEWVETAKIALQALGRLGKRICINRIKLLFVCSADDPFDAAMHYNTASAVLHTLLPLIENKFTVKKKQINLSTDYDSEKSIFEFGITMSIRIGHFILIALMAAFAFLKVFIRNKHNRKNERKALHG